MGSGTRSLHGMTQDMRRIMGLGSWQFVLVVVCHLACTAWAQQKEITDEQLKQINTANNLDLKKAFRCGLFFPPEIEGQLPIAPLFIFNSSFPQMNVQLKTQTGLLDSVILFGRRF